ncbi:MAG: hypothetical protein OSA89_18380 [Mariniblastus sp.]|nr:hypothetical protein [Mariniblastus sp.]
MSELLVFDYRNCNFSDVDTALCEYAIELTCRPAGMSQASVERLREVGLSDDQVTIATQVISYFNYINRIADGLGVDLEDWMTISEASWSSLKPNWRA